MSHTESWLTFEDAISHIISRRHVRPEIALSNLRERCLRQELPWRYVFVLIGEKGELLIPRGLPPDMLTFWSEVQSAIIHPLERQIEIMESSLRTWLARPRRGPDPGMIARYADSDRALFDEPGCIMREGSKSVNEAARDLAWQKKVEGRGSLENRARRLAKLFRKERLRRAP
jgi:hypothetical protein